MKTISTNLLSDLSVLNDNVVELFYAKADALIAKIDPKTRDSLSSFFVTDETWVFTKTLETQNELGQDLFGAWNWRHGEEYIQQLLVLALNVGKEEIYITDEQEYMLEEAKEKLLNAKELLESDG